MYALKPITCLVLVSALILGPALCDDTDETEDLQQAVQNPLASLVSVPFQNNTLFKLGPLEKTQNVLNIQPILPFKMNSNWNLISRTILPVISQPEFIPDQGRTDGLGDLTQTLFFSPSKPAKWIWGVGPIVTFPTATDDRLGSDAWSLGPSVVVLTMPGKWVIGTLISNIWDVFGSGDVDLLTWQYFVNYNMARGWYLTSAPLMTANWNASSGEKWTVPVGGGGGRIFHIGAQPFNVSGQLFYNVEAPTTVGDWSMRIQIQLMFPKGGGKKGD